MSTYWVIWDAAATWIVDRLISDGRLPALGQLRAQGVRGSVRPPTPNCQTPPSLATLLTGTPAHVHGVTGFRVPVADSLIAQIPGFAPQALNAEPIWTTLAAHGRSSSLVHVPWAFDANGGVGQGVHGAIESYSGQLGSPETLHEEGADEVAWPVGSLDVRVRFTATGATVTTALGSTEVDANGGWVPIAVDRTVGFHVRMGVGDSPTALIRTATWRTRIAGDDPKLVRSLRDAPLFCGKGVAALYRKGELGTRAVDGGGGKAEQALLDGISCVSDSISAAARAVLKSHSSDLVIVYVPWTDEVGHEIAGLVDRSSAAHRDDLEDSAWALLDYAYSAADALLEEVVERADPTTDTVVVCADHGMAGFTHRVLLNRCLVDNGLAELNTDGQLSETSQVIYHPANNGMLYVNGHVLDSDLPEEEAISAAMARAMTVLQQLPGPSGHPAVSGFLDHQGRPIDKTHAHLGSRAYVVLGSDLQPSAELGPGPMYVPQRKTGAHLVNDGAERLYGTMAAAGPGLPAGSDLGVVDATEILSLVQRQTLKQ